MYDKIENHFKPLDFICEGSQAAVYMGTSIEFEDENEYAIKKYHINSAI